MFGYWTVDRLPKRTFFEESSFFNGMNRRRIVTAASGDLEILQGLPLSSNGIEERWADGGGGSPEENSDVM